MILPVVYRCGNESNGLAGCAAGQPILVASAVRAGVARSVAARHFQIGLTGFFGMAVFDAKFAKNIDAKSAKALRPLCVKTFAFFALKTRCAPLVQPPPSPPTPEELADRHTGNDSDKHKRTGVRSGRGGRGCRPPCRTLSGTKTKEKGRNCKQRCHGHHSQTARANDSYYEIKEQKKEQKKLKKVDMTTRHGGEIW